MDNLKFIKLKQECKRQKQDVPDIILDVIRIADTKEASQRRMDRRKKLDYIAGLTEMEAIEDALSTEDIVFMNLQYEQLYFAISRLHTTQKSRIIRYYFYGMSYSQIACLEGVSKSAIHQSIAGALKKMRKYF